MILRHHYVLAVPDAQSTADFFIHVLGFTSVPVGDKGWRFVRRNDCMIMLGSCPDAIHPSKLGDHSYFAYLVVENADAYHTELQSKEVQFLSPIADKPWGMREFGIKTPDGHRIVIGHPLPRSDSQ